MNNPPVTLASALTRTISPEITVEYRAGMTFRMRFLPRSRFRALMEKHTELKYDDNEKARVPKLNADAFTHAFLKETVLGWSGITLRALSQVCEVNIDGLTDAELDAEFPFSVEDLKKIMDMSYDLDSFFNKTPTDIRAFRPNLEAEVKNSATSQTTS